jgi:nucleoside-diphosphate-sugar epimerase
MTVLITGICGFVGSTLARALREHGDESALGILGTVKIAGAC